MFKKLEKRLNIEYVKQRHGRCKKIKIKLPEIKTTMSEMKNTLDGINSRSNGWKFSKFDENLQSSTNPEHEKYEVNYKAHYNEIA